MRFSLALFAVLGAVLGVVVAAAGCSGRRLGSYGELCDVSDDCAGDLICAATNTGSICAGVCEIDTDCTGPYGALAYCSVGSLACLQACDTEADCDGDTTCMEGFCEAGMAPP
jgi:hypothetical protein